MYWLVMCDEILDRQQREHDVLLYTHYDQFKLKINNSATEENFTLCDLRKTFFVHVRPLGDWSILVHDHRHRLLIVLMFMSEPFI